MKILVIGRKDPIHPTEVIEEQEIAKSLQTLVETVDYADESNYKFLFQNRYDFIFIAKLDLDWEFVFSQKLSAKIIYWMPDHCRLWEMESVWQGIAKEVDVWIGKQYDNVAWAKLNDINYFYWNFDVGCSIHQKNDTAIAQKAYGQTPYPDVVPIGFIGNWVHDNFRTNLLKELQAFYPEDLHITTQSIVEMTKRIGLKNVHYPLFGESFNSLVHLTKINLCIDNVINDGYWSNRIGRILNAGGFVLSYYTKGMEKVFGDYIEYFGSVKEGVEKINYYLEHEDERKMMAGESHLFAQSHLQPNNRTKELLIYLKTL